jgi:hypothetical protein
MCKHHLFVGISNSLSISKCSSHLPILGQVEGGNFFCLLNLFFVGLNLTLKLVNQSLELKNK